ncbi:MAG TPA: hypothetical protein VFG09_00290 [Thermodesulfovibrionales bacterium]|nr:hypothetical protein [Thermodesulfovibrionales bacterium]
MSPFEVLKKFIRSSTIAENWALNIYEGLPLALRYRICCGPGFFRWLSFLKESEEWDRERFDAYQFEQTKNLLDHAMKNVPFYRRLFPDVSFSPLKMQSLDDLRTLPCLTKETVRDNPAQFVDEHLAPDSLRERQTSGSSGIPLTMYENREAVAAFHAFRANLLARIGHSTRSKEVMLWSSIEVGRTKNLPFLRYGNKLILSIRYLSGAWLYQFSDMIREFDPAFIAGFPSALSVLSSFIKNTNLSSGKKPRAVISYAETLYDWQRTLIEEAFGARVFSMYAMTELSTIGAECECSTRLHLHPAYGMTELTDALPGYREIVATGFTNYAMPLIRYKTGDLVKGHEEFCSQCNRPHKNFPSLEGRTDDFLIGSGGEVIPRLMPWIKTFPNTKQFQFVQEEPGRAYLRIVRGKAFSKSDTLTIRSKLDEMLGPMKDAIEIELDFVDEIPKRPSGKMKLVVQRLKIRDFLEV